jgi:protein involved in polysaccharide export with SLBB domain
MMEIVPVINDEASVDYSNAFGSEIYRGLPPHRMGRGLGSALRARFQALLPLLRSVAAPVVQEAATAAGGVLADIAQDRRPLETSLKRRGGKAVRRLLRKSIDVIKQSGGRRTTIPLRRKRIPRPAKRKAKAKLKKQIKKRSKSKNKRNRQAKRLLKKDALGRYV